jgi:NADPH2 dehydrogenase
LSQLLKPLQAGSLELANRLVMPPMATSKAEPDGKVSPAILEYYREKSAGGYFSLIIIEHSFVQQAGKASNNQLSVADDKVVDSLKELAAIIHANGSKTVMQINHAGSAADQAVTGSVPVGPSTVKNPGKGGMPHELTVPEIREIVDAFGAAARRVKQAGFDGVEIHSAHGYFLNQFFSPLTNRRTDAYGGDVLGRIRIHLEVIAAVRAAVGENFPILLRLGAADYTDGGTTAADSQIAAREFVKAGVRIIDISGGFCGYNNPENSEPGYFASLSAAVKDVVSVPVILTGGITDAGTAERFLAQDKADLIGIGRAVMQDSEWAKKAVESLK